MDKEPLQPRGNGDAAALLWPALQVGACSGVTGFLVGGTAGLLKNSSPALFATGSGLQWFALGTTFWGTRSFILQAWTTPTTPVTSSGRASASAIAGGVAGAGVGLLTRGPRNAIPGGIMFSLFGYGGQALYSMLDAKHTAALAEAPKQNIWQKIANWKYTPVTVLTDAEYEDMLRERALRLDAEIALIDDRIAELKKQFPKEIPQPNDARQLDT